MASKVLSTLAALVVTVAGLAPPASASAPSSIRPVRECAELVRDFDIPGAKTHVTSATAEAGHCDVQGYVEPAVRFHLKLPTTTYQGRYVQYGCGGWCGFLIPPAFPDCGPNAGNAAVAATDDGHQGEGFDGRWAANNQAARDDFFFRAPHVLSKASKQIIATYYGAPPKQSYFVGCSTGGREGLLLAQRYPDDFDGIIAAAPANYLTALVGYQAWLAKSNTDPAGEPIITAEKLPVLTQAVVAACDRLDGLVDGQLEDPRACRFDPASIQCPGGTNQPNCLTAAQVGAARKLYAGPTDEHGRKLYPGNQAYGSELAWYAWIMPSPELGPPASAQLADNYLKYVGYPIGRPHSSLAQYEFTAKELHRLTPEGVKANAMSLDLSGFKRSGGKLILWHGWSDQGIPADGTLDYFQRLGGDSVRDWARMFVVPAMFHCQGGTTLTDFDPFRSLIAWVERGTAPDKIIASGKDQAGNVLRTRPVFPYPLKAKYDGTGSIDDASNFVPVRPSTPPRDAINWVGSYLHHIPGPTAP